MHSQTRCLSLSLCNHSLALCHFNSSPLNTDDMDPLTSPAPHEIRMALKQGMGIILFNTTILTPSTVMPHVGIQSMTFGWRYSCVREFMTKPEPCKRKKLVGIIALELQGAWAHWPPKVKNGYFVLGYGMSFPWGWTIGRHQNPWLFPTHPLEAWLGVE